MKIKEIRDLTGNELSQKELELRVEIFNDKTQRQLGKIEHPHQLRIMRKDIARIKTVLKERQNIKGTE